MCTGTMYSLAMAGEYVDSEFPLEGISSDMLSKFEKLPKDAFIGAFDLLVVEVVFLYSTVRGHEREGRKYMFLNSGIEADLEKVVASHLNRFVSEFNREYPYRAITVKKIKSVTPYARMNVAV